MNNQFDQCYRYRSSKSDMAATTKVADGIYSLLSPAQLKELKRCIAIAYRDEAKQKREYVTLACQPKAAERFMSHHAFRSNNK